MGEPQKPIIERVFELAHAGASRSVGELEKALKAEGYEDARYQLQGSSLRAQLRQALTESGKQRNV